MTVVDTTISAPIVHQGSNPIRNHGARPAADYNEQVAMHTSGHDYLFGTIDNADVIAGKIVAQNLYFTSCSAQRKLLHCAFIHGTLYPQGSLPKPVQKWLNTQLKRAPKGTLLELALPENLAAVIIRSPRFRVYAKRNGFCQQLYFNAQNDLPYFFVTEGKLDHHDDCMCRS